MGRTSKTTTTAAASCAARADQHYLNARQALLDRGDTEGAARPQETLNEVDRAIEDFDYRAANIRAGYVYVISNIGALGEAMVKVGMTRRLDPLDRVRELGDASVYGGLLTVRSPDR